MWKLLWTESKYNKLLISAAHVFCFICFLAIWFGVRYEHNRVPLIMLNILVVTVSVSFTLEGGCSKERRNRFKQLLPVSSTDVYMSRVLFPIFLWISLAFLLFSSYAILKLFSIGSLAVPSVKQLLSVNGLILIVSAVYLLNIDMKIALSKKHLRVLFFTIWIMVYVASLSPFFILTDFLGVFSQHTTLQDALLNLFSSTTGSVALNSLGLALILMYAVVFVRNRLLV